MNQTTIKWIVIPIAAIISLCIISGLVVTLASPDNTTDKNRLSALEAEVDDLESEKKSLQERVKDLKNQEPEQVEVLSETCKTALTNTSQAMIDYNYLVSSIGEKLGEWAENPYGTTFDDVLAEQEGVGARAVEAAGQAKACYPEISVSFNE